MRSVSTYKAVLKHLENVKAAAKHCPDTTILLATIMVLLGRSEQAESVLADCNSGRASADYLVLLLALQRYPKKIVPFLHP